MSKDQNPTAEVNFEMRIMAGARPVNENDREWAIRILASIIPQMLDRVSFYLTRNADLADRRDGKPMSREDVMDAMCAVLCENLCSTWFMSGGSKKHLLKLIDGMYTAFEEEMTSATEEQSDGDYPVPTVKEVGHA